MIEKRATSFRLSKEALRLLGLIADSLGLSLTGCLETAIREMAERKGIK